MTGPQHSGSSGERPAWDRSTQPEHWPAVTALALVAALLQLSLPRRVATHPWWLLPLLALVLSVTVFPGRRYPGRPWRLAPIAALTVANAASGARLVVDLLDSSNVGSPALLLRTGATIWLVNVLVFTLWYWEFDRGGPRRRAEPESRPLDFWFPQMDPEIGRHVTDWEPSVVDYLYLSFTNATAFSPTDVLPLSRWAKMAMLVQSALSLSLVALVIARAVNVLG